MKDQSIQTFEIDINHIDGLQTKSFGVHDEILSSKQQFNSRLCSCST